MSRPDAHTAPADDDSAGGHGAAARFTDPRAAGRRLAAQLGERPDLQDAVVLGVANGGVPVALEVARGLGSALDLVLIRRLFAPRGPLDTVCAVSVAGSIFLDEELTAGAETRDAARGAFVADALAEFARRVRVCRGERPALELTGRSVLLVDNGIHTGSTMRVALRAVRAQGPARVVAAVPVAAPEARAAVEPLADELVCLAWPRPFGHVGLWYADLQRPGDAETRELLEASAPPA